MEASPSTLAKLLLPKTPFILKTALLHALSFSETSSKWNMRTELTIKILRQMLGPDSPTSSITKQQRLTTKDPGVKGNVWVSKVSFPIPEEDEARQAVFRAIKELDSGPTGDSKSAWTEPESKPLEAEWTGYRASASKDTPEPPNMSESAKYEALMKEVTSPVTILYFHGGAMFLLDPATYRPTTSKLAHLTGGRVLSVRYRLAPQNPFPAAILDALNAYLSLLYPPPGSPHAPIPAHEIVFAGDSAGGMLCTALLQLLLQIRRSSPPNQPIHLQWHGKPAEIPLPAGIALVSPWLDVTRSLPSVENLARFDYLPPPSHTHGMKYPECPAWPTKPPRADLYCEGSAMLHPLISPLAAKDWSGPPPIFFSVGQEMLRDEDAVLAKRLHGQGVVVVYREFEAMPHVFAYMLETLPESALHFEEFATFCKMVVGVRGAGAGGGVESSCQRILAKKLKREEVGFEKLTELSDEEVAKLMGEAKGRLENKVKGGGSAEARPML